jgi:3-methyladenine DNA glycosylase AlkD
MKKIQYRKVPYSKITSSFLKGFIRYQETKEVLYNDEGILKQKTDEFVNDWDQKELINISKYLRKAVKNGSTLFAAFVKDLVVGFILIDKKIFYDEYINVPYVHTTRGYRGFGIGRYLFLLGSIAALQKGAKRLYISSHPAIETQAFYQKMGCVLTEKINPDLLALEPLDIQYEVVLDYHKVMLDLLHLEVARNGKMNAVKVGKIASSMSRYMPSSDDTYKQICLELIRSSEIYSYSLGTTFIKKRPSLFNKENMSFFESILLEHIEGWGQVDQYCYRVLHPMITLDETYYNYLLKWSSSPNKDVRRASLVAMIKSSGKLTLEYEFEKMIFLVEKLKSDTDYHVRKAVGWVLKCAYLVYPNQTERYLRTHVKTLDRMIFRYALEHIKDPLRKQLMSL